VVVVFFFLHAHPLFADCEQHEKKNRNIQPARDPQLSRGASQHEWNEGMDGEKQNDRKDRQTM